MTSAATETRSADARSGARRVHIDLIGFGALAIAVAAGIMTIAVLLLTPAAGRPAAPNAPALVAPPARDQWYLDARRTPDTPKDRWYADPPYQAR